MLNRVVAGMVLLACALTAVPAENATLVIHADQPGPIIDRHIYGHFAEHLGSGIYGGVWVGEQSSIPNIQGFRSDVIGALKDLRVPVVRWPGGCFADEYHWRDGIGPRDKRPVTVNTNWGGVAETNQFGTHEFMQFAELIGADAYINGNLGTGSPREAAEWLQYLTSDQHTTVTAERARNGHPKPWKVGYFAVGNEAWGCGGNMSADYYVDQFRQYSAFLKAPQGARPQIIASGGHDDDTSWSETLSARVPEGMDAVTFHYYTLPGDNFQHKGAAVGFGEAEWISTFAHTLLMDDFISRNSAVLDRHDPQKKIALFVDEWGTWYDAEPGREPGFLYQQNTLRDALVAAVNFNIFHRHADRVRMANIAQMVNVLQAVIQTDGARMILTPTYHVFAMFRAFQDAASLPIELNSPDYEFQSSRVPALSASAARTTSGSTVVALVNLQPRLSVNVHANLGTLAPHVVEAQILSGASMDGHNTFDAPHAIEPQPFRQTHLSRSELSLTMPAKSIVVITLR